MNDVSPSCCQANRGILHAPVTRLHPRRSRSPSPPTHTTRTPARQSAGRWPRFGAGRVPCRRGFWNTKPTKGRENRETPFRVFRLLSHPSWFRRLQSPPPSTHTTHTPARQSAGPLPNSDSMSIAAYTSSWQLQLIHRRMIRFRKSINVP